MLNKKLFITFLGWCVAFFLIPIKSLMAAGLSLGQVAQNLTDTVDVASDFVNSGCVLIGVSFLFASIVKFIEHRRSPLMVPISTVIFLLVAGTALILLPLIAMFTDNGISYSLFKS